MTVAPIGVLTASAGAGWEASFVTASGAGPAGVVEIVRRCVDTVELVAAGTLRAARVALVDARLPGVDRGVIHSLHTSGVAVVGVSPDALSESKLRLLGVTVVVAATSSPAVILDAISDALLPDLEPAASPAWERGDGRVIAVWGPTGAPGRSTVAMSVADECAATGVRTLLVDADAYGGSLAQMLGILDEAPGLLAASRLANEGRLDRESLASCARQLPGGLLVLTGMARPQRWTELRTESFMVVIELARELADVIVIDCGFCIEQDEELLFDTMAPRRNGVSVATLSCADRILLVAAADPVGLQRAVRAGISLAEVVPVPRAEVVVTRLRRGPLPGKSPTAHINELLTRHLGVAPTAVIPSDRPACDRGLLEGRTLREVAPGSSARLAMRELARLLVPEASGGWLRRRTRPKTLEAPREPINTISG